MHMANSKSLVILGATILMISTFGLLWVQPDYASHFQSLHLSTTRTQTVRFQQRKEFFDMSDAGDGNWTALLPPNGGFLSHRSRDGQGYEMVGVTMFHQLHCLQMIRSAIQDLTAGRPLGSKMDAMDVEEKHERDDFGIRRRHGPHLDQDHYVHCFDYLMQGILCSADDTIEFAHDDGEGRRAVDGYEVTHQCRSADAIWANVMGAKSTPGWKSVTDLKQ